MGWRDRIGLKPTLAGFANDLLRGAARSGLADWQFDAATQSLKSTQGSVFNLTNAFLDYCNAPAAERAAVFERHLAMLTDFGKSPPSLWSLARKNVYPLLRSRYDSLAITIRSRGESASPVRLGRPWHGDLVVRIAYDFGQHTTQVTQPKLDTWGVSEDELFDVALANLRAHPKPRWLKESDGLWTLDADEGYQESHLLLGTTIFATLPAKGAAITLATNRGVLLATGADEPGGLEALLAAARSNILERPWPIDLVLLRAAGDGQLLPCEPEGVAARTLAALRRIDRAGTYAGQKDALEPYHEQAGIDVYVATFSLLGDKGDPDSVRSWCSWAKGVATLLPVTDLIGFVRSEADGQTSTALVAWDAATRICGHYLTPTDEDPMRYRVDAFPNDAEWQALLQAAESHSG